MVRDGDLCVHFGAMFCAEMGQKNLAENPVVFKALIR